MSTEKLEELSQRLKVFEDEKIISTCMHRYMALCDDLNEDFDLDTLMVLFSNHAIWQGKGKRYAKTFGCYVGKQEIRNMFAKYTKAPAHFQMNAHFLCNELIALADDKAEGSWMLIQPSTFSTGKSQLSCARIKVNFICEKGEWLISEFTTENIFSRPMQAPWDNIATLAVPK